MLPPSLGARERAMPKPNELGYATIEAGNCAVVVSDSATIAQEIHKRTGTLASQYPDVRVFLEFYDASKAPQCRYARRMAHEEEKMKRLMDQGPSQNELQPLPWGQGQSVPQADQSGNQPAAWGPGWSAQSAAPPWVPQGQGQSVPQADQSGNQPAAWGPGWSAQSAAPPWVPQGQGQSVPLEGQSGNQPASWGPTNFPPAWCAPSELPAWGLQGPEAEAQAQAQVTTWGATSGPPAWGAQDQGHSVQLESQSGNQPVSSWRSRSPLRHTTSHDTAAKRRRSKSPTSDAARISNLETGSDLTKRLDHGGEMEKNHSTRVKKQTRGDKKGRNLHRSDITQRTVAPYLGKYALSEDEQIRIQLHGTEVFKRDDRYREQNTCANCGHHGHWLGDCAFPDDDGSIGGCPLCNSKMHCWDQCSRAQSLSTRIKAELIVLRRANKPPIRSRLPFIKVLQDALDKSFEYLFAEAPGMPWTMEFTRNEMYKKFEDQAWINKEPYLAKEFPRDEESSEGTLAEIAHRESLTEEEHQLFLNI
ncbi:hypothetical protein CaCOL14_009919 [Colletotrichum acutatum]